ncbi:MAG: 4Fe-4S binding protein [Candidatus Helarchaeales archaeon]
MSDPYQKIVEKLNKMALGAPKSPKFIEYLKLYFNKEEAEIMSYLDNLTSRTLTAKKVAKLSGRDPDEVKEILERLVKKGAILRQGNRYALHAIVDYFDLPLTVPPDQVTERTRKMARLSEDFYKEDWHEEVFSSNRPFLRVIPVEETIQPGQKVTNADEISERLKRATHITRVRCPCRSRMELLGERKCNYPLESCLMLDFHGENYTELGLGTPLTYEEAMEWIKETTKMGLVHLVENCDEGPYFFICSCCECCCMGLRGLMELNHPRAVAAANYHAVVNKDTCVGCNPESSKCCVSVCKFGAASQVDGIAVIDKDKCMGCGVCAAICPTNSISLVRIEREEVAPNLAALYGEISKEKGRPII